jgi:Zn-dependent peptidase ImmA (M78 family)
MIKSIRIGYRTYQIKAWTDLELVTTESYGQCDKQRGIIYVCTHLDDVVIADTLLHEVLHAVWHEYGLQDDDREERIVHTLASGLIQVMRDNPQVIRYLLKLTRSQ